MYVIKRTVILSPYKNEFSGTATISDTKVIFNVSYPASAENRRLKLYALSTSRAAVFPEATGAVYINGRSTEFETDLNNIDESLKGCRPDTYLITCVYGEKEESVLAAFFALEWNVARVFDNRFQKSENDEYNQEDKTLLNAHTVLESLKTGKKADIVKIKEYVYEFHNNIKTCEKYSDFVSDGFEWYKIPCNTMISGLSAIKHIFSGARVKEAVASAGYYIAGINTKDCCHIAIGIPGCKHICPMPYLTDCCDYDGGFHITGIYLDEEGQYFEKYLQNMK